MSEQARKWGSLAVRNARLRKVHPDEARRARTFWDLHPSEFLEQRPVEQLRVLAEHGGIFVLELDSHWAACSAMLPVGELPVVELSDTRVVEGLAGFGLQQLLLTPIRLATALMGDDGSDLAMVIDRANSKSMQNCKANGFMEWSDAPVAVRTALELVSPADRARYELLRLPHLVAWRQVSSLLSRVDDDANIKLPRNGEELTVALEVDLLASSSARKALTRAAAAAISSAPRA